MSDQPTIRERRSSWQPLAVSVTVNGVTTIHVHGPAGLGTSVVLRKHGVETVLPSATIVNVDPRDLCVAWNGESYVMCEGIADIVASSDLEYVARVLPIEGMELLTGVHPSVYGYAPIADAEVGRRLSLLDEYKAATGASHKQIYEAENSGIYKAEFYKWRDGRLPASSSTTINFERFLREKKRPVKSGR